MPRTNPFPLQKTQHDTMTSPTTTAFNRRNFIRSTAALATGFGFLGLLGKTELAHAADNKTEKKDGLLVIGPKEGYTPLIGTLVSMLNYNRNTVVRLVQSMSMAELDHLHDGHANTIGALIMHLGATDKFYQINTFEGRQEFNAEEQKEWGAAMELDDKGRQEIKGHDVQYYLDKIKAVRERTLALLKEKDDNWLLAVDPEWSKKEPINTFWKWFHVCEHESNHRGQIAFLKSRLPGAKPGKD